MRLLCVSRSKGNGIAQLRDQRRKKARIFVVSNGGGGSREKRKTDVSCGKNRYVSRPVGRWGPPDGIAKYLK